MKKIFYFITLIILIILMANCSTFFGGVNYPIINNGPIFEPISEIPEGKGLIYFYWLEHEEDFAVTAGAISINNDVGTFRFLMDNSVIGGLNDGSYFPYFIEPGEHTILLEHGINQNYFFVSIEPGKTYYIRFYLKGEWRDSSPGLPNSSEYYAYSTFVKPTDSTYAKEEISNCYLAIIE